MPFLHSDPSFLNRLFRRQTIKEENIADYRQRNCSLQLRDRHSFLNRLNLFTCVNLHFDQELKERVWLGFVKCHQLTGSLVHHIYCFISFADFYALLSRLDSEADQETTE